MTDRPILFSAEMVRAILKGRKTQTRRVMKPQPSTVDDAGRWYRMKSGGESLMTSAYPCPYGAPGDTLWVRETWTQYPIELNPEPCDAWYKATSNGPPPPFKWRPSIHMPRWASRITLRITDIRVERLQDISEDDARAEGVSSEWDDYERYGQSEPYRYGFSALWSEINGPDAWDANPWVWVISFERVKP
jgi:hypothetical protein